MSSFRLLSLPLEAQVAEIANETLSIECGEGNLVVHKVSRPLCDALKRLRHPGSLEGDLTTALFRSGGLRELARFYQILGQLARGRCLTLSVCLNVGVLATLLPLSAGFVLNGQKKVYSSKLHLSRFAYIRREGANLVMESPRGCARVLLLDERVIRLVYCLASETELCEPHPNWELPEAAVAELLGLLELGGMVVRRVQDQATCEDSDPALACWEFHDLLFHTRSRSGRHGNPMGATYRLLDKVEPPAGLRLGIASNNFPLPFPNLDALQHTDPPFIRVQEERTSSVAYAENPLSERDLGEYLYRVARVTSVTEKRVTTPSGTFEFQAAARPYPAGGGIYEIDFYLVVNRCGRIPPGLYYYDALRHELVWKSSPNQDVNSLLMHAGAAARVSPSHLQVLFVLTSRFPRIAWKYSSMAYALTLKNLGVIYQTMYLVATAMSLAPCAIGGGDSDAFARATGIPYYEETSVGEFLLGSSASKPATMSPRG